MELAHSSTLKLRKTKQSTVAGYIGRNLSLCMYIASWHDFLGDKQETIKMTLQRVS